MHHVGNLVILQKTRYAVKVLSAFARAGYGKSLSAADIAGSEKIPIKYLEGILLLLKEAGLLESRRGHKGGYKLIREPEKIPLSLIVRLTSGPIAPLPCLSRTAYSRCDDCQDENSCTVRAGLAEAYAASLRALEETSIADAIKRAGG